MINVTSLGNGGVNASSSDLVIGPFTPTASAVLLLALQVQDASTAVSVSGHGTWVQVLNQQWTSNAARYTQIWACQVSESPSSASVTVSSGYTWKKEGEVFELTGDIDLTGTLAAAFGVADITDGYNLSPTVATPAAFENSSNMTFVVSGGYNSNLARTWEPEYTVGTRHDNSGFSMQCGWKNEEDNSVSVDQGSYTITGVYAFEIKRDLGGGGVSVTNVGDESFYPGETGISVAGTGFGFSQGSGTVKISPTDNVNDTNAVVQTVTAWGNESISFTGVRGALSYSTDLYLFVTSDAGPSNASGYVVQFWDSTTTVTDAGDEAYYSDETAVVLSGSGFGTAQGAVYISPTNNVADSNKVAQSVTSWGPTSIQFTANRFNLLLNTDYYLFVVNSVGVANSSGHVVRFVPRSPIVPVTNLSAQNATVSGSN